MKTLLLKSWLDFQSCWNKLILTDLIYNIVAIILLTPLVAGLFHIFLSISSSSILSDQDILFFFLSPTGGICLVTVATLGLAIVAVEMAALLAILATRDAHKISLLQALQFASANAWPTIQVTARIILKTLLATMPFLVFAAIVYFALLSKFDINYYLKEKPPEFLVAIGIGIVIATTLLVILLRLFSAWFYALPLILFEGVDPANALKVSSERASGHRRALVASIVGWAVALSLFSTLLSATIIGLGTFFVPRAIGSLSMLTFAIGFFVILWSFASLVINLLSTTTFAALLFNLYRKTLKDGYIDTSRLISGENSGSQFAFQITPARLIAGGIAGILVTVIVGFSAIEGVQLKDDVVIMAHRGASAAAPENTMAAITQAINDQADWVEIDVQETADGQVVVFHDSDFMKLASNKLKIWDATTDDLKQIDIGSWFDPAFSSERVPTLGEVLDVCKGKVGVNIELKYYGHDQQLEQRVVDIVEAHQMSEQIVVMSLKLEAVKKMKSIRPDWEMGLLMSVAAGNLKSIEADFLAVNAAFVDRSFVQSAQNIDKEVYVWTVNDVATMSAMMGCGVDGIITDKPALARSVLIQRAQMNVPQRLLVELAELFGVDPQISAEH